MMNRIRTTGPLQLLMLLAGFLVCSGYAGIMAICLDCDDGSHFAPMDAGCCHCADSGDPSDGPATGGAGYHNHCTKLGVPSDFLISGQLRSLVKEASAFPAHDITLNPVDLDPMNFTARFPRHTCYLPFFSDQHAAILAATVLIC